MLRADLMVGVGTRLRASLRPVHLHAEDALVGRGAQVDDSVVESRRLVNSRKAEGVDLGVRPAFLCWGDVCFESCIFVFGGGVCFEWRGFCFQAGAGSISASGMRFVLGGFSFRLERVVFSSWRRVQSQPPDLASLF
jgi:hypothetical protein